VNETVICTLELITGYGANSNVLGTDSALPSLRASLVTTLGVLRMAETCVWSPRKVWEKWTECSDAYCKPFQNFYIVVPC
jgi:hypothetical protein